MLGDADSLIRGGFKFTTWLPSQSFSNTLMQYSNAEKWLHFARCLPKFWMKNDNPHTKGCVHTIWISFRITLTCLSSGPVSPCFARQLYGDSMHAFGHITCLLRVFPNDAENLHALQDILDADFYHLHTSGKTPVMFINNWVPNYNSLPISVSNKTILPVFFVKFQFVKLSSSAINSSS